MQGVDVFGVVIGYAAGTCPASHTGAALGLQPMVRREYVLLDSLLDEPRFARVFVDLGVRDDSLPDLVALHPAADACEIVALLHPLCPVLIEILLNEAQRPPELVERGGELDGAAGGLQHEHMRRALNIHLNYLAVAGDLTPAVQAPLNLAAVFEVSVEMLPPLLQEFDRHYAPLHRKRQTGDYTIEQPAQRYPRHETPIVPQLLGGSRPRFVAGDLHL